jgi:hypothetical protein
VSNGNEEIEVDDDDLLHTEEDISEGDMNNYGHQKKYKLKKDINTESIGHNTLEHETFSMG